TTFRIYLPSSREPVEMASETAAPEVPRGAGEVVLLAEDEPVVRHLAAESLRSAGYTVLEAPTAPEAAQMCAEHEGPIHLLLTDVVMPQLSGPALARQA